MNQKELKEHILGDPTMFDKQFQIWQCPCCEHLNRFADTFGEICENCRRDFTRNWDVFIVYPIKFRTAATI